MEEALGLLVHDCRHCVNEIGHLSVITLGHRDGAIYGDPARYERLTTDPDDDPADWDLVLLSDQKEITLEGVAGRLSRIDRLDELGPMLVLVVVVIRCI